MLGDRVERPAVPAEAALVSQRVGDVVDVDVGGPGSLLKGGRGGSVSQPLDLAIVAHCVDVDPQNVPDSSRDPEGGRFRTGRDHDRKPRVGVADFLGRHSPQQLAV